VTVGQKRDRFFTRKLAEWNGNVYSPKSGPCKFRKGAFKRKGNPILQNGRVYEREKERTPLLHQKKKPRLLERKRLPESHIRLNWQRGREIYSRGETLYVLKHVAGLGFKPVVNKKKKGRVSFEGGGRGRVKKIVLCEIRGDMGRRQLQKKVGGIALYRGEGGTVSHSKRHVCITLEGGD